MITLTQDKKNTLFFDDGKRRIDLILVYEEEDLTTGVLTEQESLRIDYRQTFEESLLREGLELEKTDRQVKLYQDRIFFFFENSKANNIIHRLIMLLFFSEYLRWKNMLHQNSRSDQSTGETCD